MPKSAKKQAPAKRLALYRQRARRAGVRRVEVTVPASDACYIQNFARAFRAGGAEAERLRHEGEMIDKPGTAKTGKELVEILRQGIGKGVDVELPPRPLWDLRDSGF